MMGTRSAAMAGLERETKSGGPAPAIRSKGLKLDAIEVVEEVFQPRLWGDQADHVKTLRDAIRNTPGHRLAPVLVWWSGRRWCVVDGHHRLDAYRGFYREHPGQNPWVPAKPFKGTLREAIAESVGANSQDKLPMSKDDKMNAAWRLTCDGGWTRREINRLTSVSPRNLTNMNRARDRLIRMGVEDLADLSWKRALMMSRGLDSSKWAPWDDVRVEEEAEKMAEKLRRHLGHHLIKKPNILAMALGLYNPGLPRRLLDYVEWEDDILEVADLIRGERDDMEMEF